MHSTLGAWMPQDASHPPAFPGVAELSPLSCSVRDFLGRPRRGSDDFRNVGYPQFLQQNSDVLPVTLTHGSKLHGKHVTRGSSCDNEVWSIEERWCPLVWLHWYAERSLFIKPVPWQSQRRGFVVVYMVGASIYDYGVCTPTSMRTLAGGNAFLMTEDIYTPLDNARG